MTDDIPGQISQYRDALNAFRSEANDIFTEIDSEIKRVARKSFAEALRDELPNFIKRMEKEMGSSLELVIENAILGRPLGTGGGGTRRTNLQQGVELLSLLDAARRNT